MGWGASITKNHLIEIFVDRNIFLFCDYIIFIYMHITLHFKTVYFYIAHIYILIQVKEFLFCSPFLPFFLYSLPSLVYFNIMEMANLPRSLCIISAIRLVVLQGSAVLRVHRAKGRSELQNKNESGKMTLCVQRDWGGRVCVCSFWNQME